MKKLKINAATCDVRKVTEETLSAYDKVAINTACIVASPAAQALMGRYAVSVNAAGSLILDGDVRITNINGPMSIHPGQAAPEEKLFLQINGPLDIAPGSEEVLRSYAGMLVNGPITCPEGVTGLLSTFQINGPVSAYPDGSIVLKHTAVLDRTFHLRAKQDALYYAAKRVVALAPDIAFEKLAEKNVRFATRQLLVSESLAEAAVPLFDERADIVVLPDGCVYVDDGVKVDENLLKRYGGRLYVAGLVHVTPESAPLLDQITYLRAGDLRVCRSLKDQVLAKGWAFDELRVVGGTVICDRAMAELDAAVLENAADGVSVLDCARVVLAEDITPELLREKLVGIADCAAVVCASKEQQRIVDALAEDVAWVGLAGEEPEDVKEDAEETGEDADVTVINAVSYTLM